MASLAMPAVAQTIGVISSPILTLDQERLFEGTGIAERVSAEIERRRMILSEENRRIEVELEAEELQLTEQRTTLDPIEFRALANGFDEKVQALRAEQDAKALQLQRLRDEERQNFLRRATPILAEILRERDALIVIDRRAAILSADSIDITDLAIERMREALEFSPAPIEPFVVPPLEIIPDQPLDVDPLIMPSQP